MTSGINTALRCKLCKQSWHQNQIERVHAPATAAWNSSVTGDHAPHWSAQQVHLMCSLAQKHFDLIMWYWAARCVWTMVRQHHHVQATVREEKTLKCQVNSGNVVPERQTISICRHWRCSWWWNFIFKSKQMDNGGLNPCILGEESAEESVWICSSVFLVQSLTTLWLLGEENGCTGPAITWHAFAFFSFSLFFKALPWPQYYIQNNVFIVWVTRKLDGSFNTQFSETYDF